MCGNRTLASLLSNVVYMTGTAIRSAPVVQGLVIHGTGAVIGETAIVQDDVALDHRITLPAVGKG